MVFTAYLRRGRTSTHSYWLVLIGALLFMASDSILAINLFGEGFDFDRPLIMVTYIGGQGLIVVGVARHLTLQ